MFARLDFPRFLVCCSGDLSDDESEEKPSVAICGGSICILTGLPLTSLAEKSSKSHLCRKTMAPNSLQSRIIRIQGMQQSFS